MSTKPRTRRAPLERRQDRMRTYGESFIARRGADTAALEHAPVETWCWTPHDPVGATLTGSCPPYEQSIETNYRPGKKRQDVVLVFPFGWHTRPLLEALDVVDLPYFYLDFDEFTAQGTVDVVVGGAKDDARALLRVSEAVLDLRDVAAVLWAPPDHMFARPNDDDEGAFLYIHRWRQLLHDLRGLVRKDALWLPSYPLNGSPEWQNKLAELALAEAEGLAVPESICTNDPARVLAFAKKKPSLLLFREFSRAAPLFPLVFLEPAQLTSKALAHLERSPCIFQRYVEKEFEVRAVMVGDRIFACRIDSQASKVAERDWRAYDNAKVRWDRMKLPVRVERALVRIGAALDLKFASFDLIRGKDGKFYFLEANRPGSTFWLRAYVGLDVAREIVHYLAQALR